MKQDNKGFSLIELIIVIAIVTILAGIGIRNLGVLKNYRSRECKDKIVSAITDVKMDCLSKSRENVTGAIVGTENNLMTISAPSGVTAADVFLVIIYENNKVKVMKRLPGKKVGDPEILSSKETVSKGNTTKIYYMLDGDTTPTELQAGNNIKIAFNRSTGELLPTTDGGRCYSKIIVETGDYRKEITIQSKTGKVN